MISKYVNKIPGGNMVVPLIIGALINSFFPEVLDIGGFTTGLARGSDALLGAFLVCIGASLNLKGAASSLKIGGVITITKFIVGIALGLIISMLFGDNFLGISSLAMIGASTNANGGLFSALAGTYGNEKEVGALPLVSLTDGPFFTMIAIGAAGIASIPIAGLISVIIPIAIGMILGALDKNIKKSLTNISPILIPFFSFALGTGIDLRTLFEAGLSGVLLGLIVTFVIGFFTIITDKLTGGTGVAGAATSSTAGNAVGTPAAIASADPSMVNIANVATPQIAASVITTAICTPILTNYIAKRNEKENEKSKTIEA